MSLKTLIKTVVVAGTLAIAGVASAATPLTFDANGVAPFSHSFAQASLPTSFIDDFSFDVLATTQGTATAISGFSVNDLSFNVMFTDAFIYKAGDVTKTHLVGNASPYNFAFVLPTLTLTAGSYVLEVVGSAKAAGGSYAGQLTLAPVPEPETYAMFLAGLGLMGAIARRRKNG